MSKALTVITFALLIAAPPAYARAPSREITQAEAEMLVQAYLGPAKAKWGWDIGKPQEGFYGVTVVNPAPGAEGVDLYDVDAHTGDVWRSVVCKQLSNVQLRAAQQKLWHRICMTRDNYRRLKRAGRMCGDGLSTIPPTPPGASPG